MSANGDTPADGEKRPSKPERKSFLLRLPADLHGELRSWAAREFRSLNAHLEYLLREAVRKRKGED